MSTKNSKKKTTTKKEEVVRDVEGAIVGIDETVEKPSPEDDKVVCEDHEQPEEDVPEMPNPELTEPSSDNVEIIVEEEWTEDGEKVVGLKPSEAVTPPQKLPTHLRPSPKAIQTATDLVEKYRAANINASNEDHRQSAIIAVEFLMEKGVARTKFWSDVIEQIKLVK